MTTNTPSRIIIIEDDAGVARLQQKRLEKAGYEVATFAHPEEAVPLIKRREIDLMILDYRLPDNRTGLDFYEELKKSGFDVPAILVTGFSNESLIVKALRAGMKDFVSKSIEYLDYLPEAVAHVLHQTRVERRLAETEAHFESIFLASPVPISVCTLEEGTFVAVNDSFLNLYEHPREKVLGTTSKELLGMITPVGRRELVKYLREVRSMRNVELVGRSSSGREIVTETALEIINFHGQECLLSMFYDVTERRRAEQLLALQKRAMDATSEGIVVSDASLPDLPIVYVNRAFEEITQYTSDEALGRNCRFLQGPDTDSNTVAEIRQAIQTGRATSVEILNYRKDGRTFWNLLSITPIRDQAGQITHLVGVQRDVTERRLIAEQMRQSQKMEAIGRLAGGIAHDFNNLLTIVLGNAELTLEDTPKNDPRRELVQEIAHAGQRAAALTTQLLAFSRKQVLEPRVVDLNVLVTESERLLKRLIGEDIFLHAVLDPHLHRVKVDPVQIEQILLNLTVNARDAMPEGGRLTIETRNTELEDTFGLTRGEVKPGHYVLLAVSDTGHGMDEATKARIFEPFFTTKERGRGTGMGLPTVYGIVQQSGGYIWVYSEVGKGTTFKIYLPMHQADVPTVTKETTKRASLMGSETLLLVEDEAMVRTLARRILESQGYRVLEAKNGDDALLVSQSHDGPLHLLITDVIMPGMSGRQLAEQLQSQRTELRVLYISGYTDNTISHFGVIEPHIAFLQKPFTHDLLAAKVRQVLDGTPSTAQR